MFIDALVEYDPETKLLNELGGTGGAPGWGRPVLRDPGCGDAAGSGGAGGVRGGGAEAWLRPRRVGAR
jgi:hypothetical protein